jgi:hypothetical protein
MHRWQSVTSSRNTRASRCAQVSARYTSAGAQPEFAASVVGQDGAVGLRVGASNWT